MNSPLSHSRTPPAAGQSGGHGRCGETEQIGRAWEILGHASEVEVSPDFADRVVARALAERRETPLSGWGSILRFGAPLAAAAALVFSLASDLFVSGVRDSDGSPVAVAGSAASVPSTGLADAASLSQLARLEAAIELLPEDAELADASVLELASVDDPARLTDEEILGLLY